MELWNLEAPSTRKGLPMSKEGTMYFNPKRSNRIVEESKVRELVTYAIAITHYKLQLLVTKTHPISFEYLTLLLRIRPCPSALRRKK